jgi:glycosyltransferase involved in cell wall biosynthesis
MRILLVNKFYYHRGGDCTAVFSLEQLLKDKGHETAVFSVKHPLNEPSPHESYFPGTVGFTTPGISGKMSAAIRIFHSREVARKFKRLLSDFKPDVVHLHNVHSYISPLVARIAHRKGLRVIWTLHDYKLLCPSYSCLRDGKPCELCYADKRNVVKYSCMKNSRAASLLAWMEAIYWNRRKLERITDRFVSPSSFLKEKMIAGGFDAKQIEVLHNFMYKRSLPRANKEDYYCYVGRLSEEKGVETLLRAAQNLPFKLKIIGGGPLSKVYRQQYQSENIEFLGQMTGKQLFPILQRALFMVIPSVCYENNPFSVIEALCMGVPVLGANTGGIPELIDDGQNGMLFTAGDVNELIEKIPGMIETPFDYNEIKLTAQEKFSADNFYERIMRIYQPLKTANH